MYSILAACLVGAQLAHATTITVLSDTQVVDFITILNGGQAPLGNQRGCTSEKARIAQQAYDDAITISNLAVAALTASPIQGRVNNMFKLLFDSAVDGPDDPRQVAEFYQVIADTSGPQTDQTPEGIILHCEDRLFEELIARGVTDGFTDPGDPCNDPDTNAYGFFVRDLDNEQDEQDFGVLVGEHIVLCTSFFQLASLSAFPNAREGDDMSADEGDDDDGTQRLESTTPGIMLHELTHRLLNTQGVLDTIVDGDGNPDGFASEFYGIIDAVDLAQNPEPGNAVSRGRFNADTYNLFAMTLIDQAKDFDWSGQGNNEPGVAAVPADGQ